MSDSAFWLPLDDVRQEVQRLATTHRNECAPLGGYAPSPLPGGARFDWRGEAYLECQEGPLADGTYGVRVRWARPGSTGERCWRLSPWCAPADRLVFPGERVRGETRETVGQLTLAEASTVPCSRHPGSMLADCGCKPLAQVMGEDLPWSRGPMLPPGDPRGSCDKHGPVCDGGCGYTRHLAEPCGVCGTEPAEPHGMCQPCARAVGGAFVKQAEVVSEEPGCEECGDGRGHPLPVDPGDYVQGAYDCDTCGGSPQDNAEVVSAPSQAPAAATNKGGSGGGEAGPSVGAPQAEWDAATARPQGWEVRCDDCQRASVHDVVPDSVCAECGGEVELLAWPDLEPNARALETIGQLEQVVRKARKAKELAACQVCCSPIREGTRYLSPPKNSPRRRVHSMCVEALARQEGPV